MGLDIQQILTQAVGFLILLGLLKILFWKPLLSLLDERKEKIASEFRQIEETKAEFTKLKLEYEAKLEAIEESAREKIRLAVLDGQRLSEEIKAKANSDAQATIEHAKSEIKYELSKAKIELKDRIVELVVGGLENVVEEKLTDKEDIKVVEAFLERIDKI